MQQARFGDIVSDERPWEYIDAVYMPGTIDDIQRKVQARVDAGVEYLMLHTLSADVEQLELIAKHIVEPFGGSVSAAPFTVDASAAALLVVDLQNDFVREGAPQEVPDARATLPAVTALLDACRGRRRAGAVHALHRRAGGHPPRAGSRPSAVPRRARAGRASARGTATGTACSRGTRSSTS